MTVVDCPECDTPVDPGEGRCPSCGYEITEDYLRDVAEARREAPEDENSER